ncbi:MAG TPA: hypothetical protein PLY93_00805 [Turneriella sp.]|nr:hypothetical protein [Turneriella sp.]
MRYTGNAYDLNTGNFLYSENHSEFYENNRHIYSRVSYQYKDGKEFASKFIRFASSKTQPTYELRDLRDGYVEGIKRNKQGTLYYLQKNFKEALNEKKITTPQPAVFDAGFDYFVRENFDAICSGINKSFYFAVPSKLDYYKFRLVRQNEKPLCRVNLEVQNILLRQLVKPIKLWYDMKTKRLLKYEGISNINGPDSKSLKVRIIFSYPKK